jgi:hypothetical protein
LDGVAEGSYCHHALRLGLITFLAPVLAQPVGNKPAPDEKSAQKVHCEPLRLEIPSNSLLAVYAASTLESNEAWQIKTNHCEERHRSFDPDDIDRGAGGFAVIGTLPLCGRETRFGSVGASPHSHA